jgi:hypothetical protein
LAVVLGGLRLVPRNWLDVLDLEPARDHARSVASRANDPVKEEIAMRFQRTNAKERIVQLVLTGEMGLLPAAAWFEVVNASPSAYTDDSWRSLPGRSDGEKLCRQVIAWVRSRMGGILPASLVEARVRELERQLDDHVARHGTVVLEDR